MAERSKDWLDQALWDLKHAHGDLQQGCYDWACFSSQQAAEKACKALLQTYGAEAWGRSVADLLTAISDQTTIDQELIDMGLELDKAYIPTRYPDAHPSGSPSRRYTKTEAGRLIEYAEQIIRYCEGLIS